MMDGGARQMVKKAGVPSDWEPRSFYDLARITSGQVDPREQPYRSMILVAPDHIRTGAGRIDEKVTAEQQGAISGKYLVRKGEIIYSKIRPNLQKLALATEDCLCSADMYPVSVRDGVSAVFLKFLMLSKPFTEFATSVSVRSGMPKINREELAHFSSIVPTRLKEQEAIAEALSDADALIEGLERLIAKKRLIKQGAMQDLLTAKRRLPGFSGEWVERKLGSVAMLQRGFDLPSSVRTDGDFPVVYSNGIMATHTKFMCEGPGVVTGRSGTIGKVTFVQGRYWPHNTALWVKNFFGNDARFIFYLLQFVDLRRFASGSGVPTLNRNDAHDDPVWIPRDVDEQHAISSVLDDIEAEIQVLETRLEKARAVKEGMMQNLLTGRIRLV